MLCLHFELKPQQPVGWCSPSAVRVEGVKAPHPQLFWVLTSLLSVQKWLWLRVRLEVGPPSPGRGPAGPALPVGSVGQGVMGVGWWQRFLQMPSKKAAVHILVQLLRKSHATAAARTFWAVS